jgi:hypothetical protein
MLSGVIHRGDDAGVLGAAGIVALEKNGRSDGLRRHA